MFKTLLVNRAQRGLNSDLDFCYIIYDKTKYIKLSETKNLYRFLLKLCERTCMKYGKAKV